MNLKHFSSLGMVAAIAGLAAVSVVAAEVTDEIASECIAGVMRVDPPVKNNSKILLAVPWVSYKNGAESPVTVSTLVKVANMQPEDQLRWYDPSEQKYRVWQVNAETNAWVAVNAVDEGGLEAIDPSKELLCGGAVLLCRKHEEDFGKPVYLEGINLTDATSVTYHLGSLTKGQTVLFAPPLTDVDGSDITQATWENVADYDTIQYYKPSTGLPVTLAYRSGSWSGTAAAKKVPMGYGVWFKRVKSDSTGDITVTWSL